MTPENDPTSLDDLSRDSRVLVNSRLLPEDRPLTPAEVADVLGDYEAHVNRHGLFDGDVGRQVNIEPKTLAAFRHRALADDEADRVARAVNAWLERDARGRKAQLPLDYVPTAVCEAMRGVATTAHALGLMAVIVMPSGAGKTMVLKLLAEQTNGVYLYVDEFMRPRAFLQLLAKAIGLHRSTALSASELMHAIIERLKGTRRALYIDEAHRLPDKVFSACRSIYDQAGVTFIFAGAAAIVERVDDRANGSGQMASRCLFYDALAQVYNAGDPGSGTRAGRALFTLEEIKALFAHRVRFDEDALTMLWAIACLPGFGCLRTARKVVQLARQRAGEGGVITRKLMRWALPLLFGDQGLRMIHLADQHVEAMRKVA